MKQAFLFVLSNVEIKAPLPMELVPGITLQRATQEQVQTIKEKLHVFGPSSLKEDIYEARWFKAENGTMQFEKPPADFWRYWIVPRTEGDRERLVDLKTACALLPTELLFGFTITKTGGLGWDTGVSVAFAKPSLMFPIGPPTAFLERDLKQISANYYLLETAKRDFSSIHRAARLFYDLRLIPDASPFVDLGLFSVIEALVTHDPRRSPTDSVNYQIKTKMPFLCRKFEPPLDYDAFKEMEPEKLWGKLYGYRSNLAHGDAPDFKRGLKALKSRNEVRRFLREAVKALVVFALKNPGILQDLKSRDCPEQTEPGQQIKELRRLAGITTRQLELVRENFEAMQELFAGVDRKDTNGSAPSRPG